MIFFLVLTTSSNKASSLAALEFSSVYLSGDQLHIDAFLGLFRVLLPCHANHTIFKFKRLCKKMFKTALISAK
ncbi:MAG TPA: hypothetical protein VIP56_02270, partial [Nitrososphaeraceae archaeon]